MASTGNNIIIKAGFIVAFLLLFATKYVNGLEHKPLSKFLSDSERHNISKVVIKPNSLIVSDTSGNKYKVSLLSPISYAEQKHFIDLGIEVENVLTPIWLKYLFPVLLSLLTIGVVIFLLKSLKTQTVFENNDFAKSKAKLFKAIHSTVSFKDVAGIEEAKDDLMEVVEFLKNPTKFHLLGASIPHGVLMVGPPGSGKTHLAKAVAGEASVPFFSVSGSDFVELYVGVGAARVRDLFKMAKENMPCIIFIDEIDGIGKSRSNGINGSNDEREQALNALLVEMDGFDSKHDIIIIAATNRPEILDTALLRPGRFDRQVVVSAPDVKGREAILNIYAKGKPLHKNVDLAAVARRTPGFVGADLKNLMNEAALVAARANHNQVNAQDIDEAADRVIMGPQRKSRLLSNKEIKITAYHESGHALASYMLEHADPVHKITIVPRGNSAGYVMRVPEREKLFANRRMLLDTIAVALAGRAAEEIIFKDVTTGAQSDFQQATKIAIKMVISWGMSDKLGHVSLIQAQDDFHKNNYSEKTAQIIDLEVQNILEREYTRVSRLLNDNLEKLDLIAQTLISLETLNAKEFEELMKTNTLSGSPNPADSRIQSKKEHSSQKRPKQNVFKPKLSGKPI